MIDLLANHIEQATIDQVVNKISEQYRSFLRLTNSPEFTNLFSKEYAPHKKQHSISWAISSAFPSGSCVGELTVSRLKYGRGHTRPVLSSNRIEIHVLNSSTNFEAQYLRDRYVYNANNFSGEKLFCYIKFWAEQRRLKKIELCLPDERGAIVYCELLLNAEKLSLVA